MKNAKQDFHQSYNQELRDQNRSPAPQLTVHLDNQAITMPVTLRTITLSDFARDRNNLARDTSPHEVTLALVIEDHGADLAATLLTRYASQRQQEDNHTDTRAIALLLHQLNTMCGSITPLLAMRGEELTDCLTEQNLTDLARRIVQESHEITQHYQE